MTTVKELIEHLESLDGDCQIYIRDKGHNHGLHIFGWVGDAKYYTIEDYEV